MKLVPEEQEKQFWDRIYREFRFHPDIHDDGKPWISVPYKQKTFTLARLWTEEQEALVNSFFEELVDGEMYALVWETDGFSFSPKEHIPFGYEYHDDERNCQVYFPTYYPDGEYNLFFDPEWKYGLLGHPWRSQIVVVGRKLIRKFEENKRELNLL